MSRYYRYRVRLTDEGRKVWVEICEPDGRIREPNGDSELYDIPADIIDLADTVQRRQEPKTDSMVALGESLFNALFPESVATDLRNLLDQIGDDNEDITKNAENFLRLELDLNEAELPFIANLPWEFLRVPPQFGREGYNLAAHPQVTLSRRQRSWRATPVKLARRLRILLVVSAPSSLGAVAYEEVEKSLQELTQNHPEQFEPLFEVLHQPTIDTLDKALEKYEPDILHFIGHGRLRSSAKGQYGELAFVKTGNKPDWCKAEPISQVFEQYKPRVVFLQACESAKSQGSQAITSVAAQIAQRNVPVVVAMQYKITNNVSTTFAEEFYRRLGQFEPVDMALQKARRQLKLQFRKTRDFAAPILFMRVEDGRLFVPPKSIESEEKTPIEPDVESTPLDAQQLPAFSKSFTDDLPHPVAVACAKFNQAETDNDRFAALDWLLNNLVKYLTALALSQYWQGKPDKKQLQVWLAELSQARLITSLTVFNQIETHYTAIQDKPYLFPVLFELHTTVVDDESPLANAYDLIRRMQRKGRIQEDISPQTFLTKLLTYREKKWEADVNQVDQSIQDKLLPALRPALEQLISIFRPLFHYPLRYIDRVDRDDQDWVYTSVEFLGSTGESVVSNSFFRESGVDKPGYPSHRLYLCASDGQPQLNLHPFLIAHLYKLYFLEQASDRSNIWYQHCASPDRYWPPEHHQSKFLGASQTEEDMEAADDPVIQLEQANSSLDEDDDERFDQMPLPILMTHFSPDARQVLEFALGESLRIGRFWLGIEFLLMGLSRQRDGILSILLREMGIHPGELRGALRGMAGVVGDQDWRRQNVAELGAEAWTQLQVAEPDQLRQTLATGDELVPIITPRMLAILKEAAKLAGENKSGHTHLMLAACRHHRSLAMQIFFSMAYKAEWSPEQVISRLAELADITPEDLIGDNNIPKSPDIGPRPGRPGGSPRPPRRGSILSQFGRNLTQAAADGRLHPVAGTTARQAVTQIGRILLKREGNNPILVGDPGVGKTAVVEGFAWRLLDQERPVVTQLAGRQVIELSANALTSGTKYRGDLEERLQQLLAEVKKAEGQTIVFIDEIHNILKGSSNEAIAEALKPALARGEFPCIGATTVAEYRQYIEKDAALARRFTPIWLEEPTIADAIKIVKSVANGHLATHHQLSFSLKAIEAAVRLSVRHLHDERLPGKAIKLLDEAAARASLIVPGSLFGGDEGDPVSQVEGSVTVEDVLEIVAERTNIPISQLGKTDKQRLLELETQLQRRIIGQDEAIAQVVRVVKRAGAGLSGSRRPQGVFLFAGPTGVGKTELALALTEALFNDEEAIFRLDMSEFMEKHQVARLTGAPPGYVGYEDEGQLTGRLRRYPYSVILFDEIEKAHPDIQHLFLQLFDNGRLTDSQGRLADGRQAIFIMTTNLGAKEALGLAAATQSYQQKLQAAIHDHFTMEFINRIDRIAYFNPLDENALFAIFKRELQPLQEKLQQENQITITVPDEIKYQIVRHIAQQKLGARPLRRFIEDKVIAPVVDKLLSDDIKPGTQITLGSEIEFGAGTPLPAPPLGEQSPPAFDLGQLNLGGGGVPAPQSLQPQRPAKPEDGLPHHDGLPDEEQAEFDELFLTLARSLAEQGVALEIDRTAKYFMCAPNAADQKPREGRSISEAFADLIETPVMEQLLEDEIKAGDWIKLDYSADGPVIKKMEEGK